jgi:hypothetical protein
MALINTTTTGIQGSTFYADGTGALTIQQNGATLGTYGNIPCVRAYMTNGGSNQTFSASTWTKVRLDTKEFDTNNNFDTTNFRYLPTIAGFYMFSGAAEISYSSAGPSIFYNAVYKNGSVYQQDYSGGYTASNVGVYGHKSVNGIVYMNGTTDYLELYVWSNSASAFVGRGSVTTILSVALIKAA